MNPHTTSIAEPETTEPVSQRVVEKVAEVTDTDPLELEPLHDVVDPDSLDRLFGATHSMAARNEGQVSFPMAGCRVVVTADGGVEVDPEYRPVRASIAGDEDGLTARATEPQD